MPSVQHSGERVYVHCTMRVRVRIRVCAHERVRVRVHVSARLEHSRRLVNSRSHSDHVTVLYMCYLLVCEVCGHTHTRPCVRLGSSVGASVRKFAHEGARVAQ